jgi:hypothetical protein
MGRNSIILKKQSKKKDIKTNADRIERACETVIPSALPARVTGSGYWKRANEMIQLVNGGQSLQ